MCRPKDWQGVGAPLSEQGEIGHEGRIREDHLRASGSCLCGLGALSNRVEGFRGHVTGVKCVPPKAPEW